MHAAIPAHAISLVRLAMTAHEHEDVTGTVRYVLLIAGEPRGRIHVEGRVRER